jgi:hypothetical protein
MPRRTLHRRTGASFTLARHLASRRLLQRRMHATTPIRFLRRLHLMPEAEAGFDSGRATLWEILEQWAEHTSVAADESMLAAIADLDAESAPFEIPLEGERTPVARHNMPLPADAPIEPPAQVSRLASERPTDMRQPPQVLGAPSDVQAARSRQAPPARRRFVSPKPPMSLPPVRAIRPADAAANRISESRPVAAPRAMEADPTAPARVSAEPSQSYTRTSSFVPALQDDAAAVETPAERTTTTSPPPVRDAGGDPVSPPRVAARMSETPARVAEAGRTVNVPGVVAPPPPAAVPQPSATPEASAPGALDEPFSALAAAISEVIESADRVAIEQPPATPVAARSARRARVEELPVERPSIPETVSPGPPPQPRLSKEQLRQIAARRAAPPPEPRERAADRLFVPTDDGVDRSPAAWAARLAQSMRPSSSRSTAPPVSSAPSGSPTRPAPAPRSRSTARPPLPATANVKDVPRSVALPIRVSQSARRFLKPLVGIDPESVTILQGPLPNRIADAHRADALAVGDDTIVVGTTFVGEMPSDLGLLGHELTHIARERRPRFVPPIARPSQGRPTAPAQTTEEGMARRVESAVVAAARNSAPGREDARRRDDARVRTPSDRSMSSNAEDVPVIADAPTPLPDVDWGGLPAPWEPLPQWLSAPESTEVAVTRLREQAPQYAVAGLASSVAAPAAVQRAEMGRAIDAPETPGGAPGPAAPADAPAAVAPDLDQLARQVYAVLKRRLEAETRREQMF